MNVSAAYLRHRRRLRIFRCRRMALPHAGNGVSHRHREGDSPSCGSAARHYHHSYHRLRAASGQAEVRASAHGMNGLSAAAGQRCGGIHRGGTEACSHLLPAAVPPNKLYTRHSTASDSHSSRHLRSSRCHGVDSFCCKQAVLSRNSCSWRGEVRGERHHQTQKSDREDVGTSPRAA